MAEDKGNEWVSISFRSSMRISREIRFDGISRGKVMVALARATCAIQGDGEFDLSVESILKDAELKLAEAATREQAAKAMEQSVQDYKNRAEIAERLLSSASAQISEAQSMREQIANLNREISRLRSQPSYAPQPSLTPQYPNIRNAPVLPPSSSNTPIQPGYIREISGAINTALGAKDEIAPPRRDKKGYEELEID